MAPLVTFLDTSLPDFAKKSDKLVEDGWRKVPNTRATSRNILFKYYEYFIFMHYMTIIGKVKELEQK